MKLEGKKVAFLGDSITEGHGLEGTKGAYWNLLKERENLREIYVDGIGGTRFTKQWTPSENPRHDLEFIPRVDNIPVDADIIVVFGGTNDFGHGDAPLGNRGDKSPYTFYGACDLLIRRLIMHCPKAEIVFMTPLHRLVEEQNGRKLKDYVKAIRQVTEYYGIPLVDLYATSTIQPKLAIIQELYCPDGLHPNEAGHEKIYKRLKGVLEML